MLRFVLARNPEGTCVLHDASAIVRVRTGDAEAAHIHRLLGVKEHFLAADRRIPFLAEFGGKLRHHF